jgi:uncharacterized membrane protein
MQTVIVVLIVLGAAFYLGERLWRSTVAARRASGADAGCGSNCGCTPAVVAKPPRFAD